MSIQLQNGKKYITAGGWVVEIVSIYQNDIYLACSGGIDYREYFFATQRTSPGTVNAKLVAEWAKSNYVSWAQHCGWEYNPYGTLKVGGAGNLMGKDLEIVSEYPYPLELPEGYKWAGGFPKLVNVTDKGYYLTSTGKVFNANEEKVRFFTVDNVPNIGVQRIALEPIAEPQAQYYLTDTVAYNGSRSFYIYKDGQWFFKDRSGEGKSLASEDQIRSYIRQGKYKSITKEEFEKLLTSPLEPFVPSVPFKKEEEMSQNKLVSVITTGGSIVAKATNYLYVEPAKIIGGYVKRSLRYIVFTGTIAGIVYGANNPDALKKRIASVLPKITIEAPSVLK